MFRFEWGFVEHVEVVYGFYGVFKERDKDDNIWSL